MFGAAQFQLSKTDRFPHQLTARGGIVDEAALHGALTTGKIAGAEASFCVCAGAATSGSSAVQARQRHHRAACGGGDAQALGRMGLQTARNIINARRQSDSRERDQSRTCWAEFSLFWRCHRFSDLVPAQARTHVHLHRLFI